MACRERTDNGHGGNGETYSILQQVAESMNEVGQLAKDIEERWNQEIEKMHLKLKMILKGEIPGTIVHSVPSPQQSKKRPKRLPLIADSEEESLHEADELSPQSSHSSFKGFDDEIPAVIPPLPTPRNFTKPQASQSPDRHQFSRPVRASKLKSEKCLKERPLNSKLRRPSDNSIRENTTASKSTAVKLETDQRQSQMQSKKNTTVVNNRKSDDSVVVLSDKEPLIEIPSGDEEEEKRKSDSSSRKGSTEAEFSKKLKVVVKREKPSLPETEAETKDAATTETIEIPSEIKPEKSLKNPQKASTNSKKSRKKKEVIHKPIKVERLSSVDAEEAIMPKLTRNRKKNNEKNKSAESVYEDAVDNLPTTSKGAQQNNNDNAVIKAIETEKLTKETDKVFDETVTISNNVTIVTTAPVNATFVTEQVQNTFAVPSSKVDADKVNATVTISSKGDVNETKNDATFNVRADADKDDSLMTEDESFEKPLKQPAPAASIKSTKLTKLPPKTTKELFNPCVQSPVRKKVEAFEIHAQANSGRSRLRTRNPTKENAEPTPSAIKDSKTTTTTTPVVNNSYAPVLGRFLTPTQASNVTPLLMGNVKKVPNSTSKMMPFPRQFSANLKSSNSTSTSSLTRENSAEEFKKGYNNLKQLAEERKKAREQKHQQAAQIREAKERERAERLQKLAKEREEKKRKKELEMEQKKLELEEINRKLKLQEERDKQTMKSKMETAEIMRQEKELLLQMKQLKQFKQPPQVSKTKYVFEMLHEDDPTDDESSSSSDRRPPPPAWSTRTARTDDINCQASMNTAIIDSFFSVQPLTPDLRQIFPDIDERYLKRNSSVIWQTPPRYSEMPKY